MTRGNAWRAIFLNTFRNSGNVRAAADAAGVSRETAYQHRNRYPEFAAEWKAAEEDAVERLEATAYLRAIQGSDNLMMFLLKAHRPEKYRENTRMELTGAAGGPIAFLEGMDDHERVALKRVLMEEAARRDAEGIKS